MSTRANEMGQEGGVPIMDMAWQRQQIKAFTAWVNGHLRKRGQQIEDIATELSDGRNLLHLVEVIGETSLPKPAKGTMRIHKIQNVNHCFKFIKEKGINLVSIAAEEIVDSNLKMILGMVWTLILRFEIQDISLDEMSAKDALLLWCQRKTQPYDNVDIQNFHMSWKDGLGFCALIHRHRPDLLDFSKLRRDQPLENLKLAIEIADKELDIPPMIDAEDIATCAKPDERSIMTYVAAYYKCFAHYNKSEAAARKIATVLDTNRDHERLIAEYETVASSLLEWIPVAIARLDDRPPLNSVQECRQKLDEFNGFRSSEYPPKLLERGDLEAHYSTLQTKLRLSGRPPYVPSEGKMIADINQAWAGLETSDKENKTWLLSELKRNQICEQKFQTFTNKADSHTNWTTGKEKALATDDFSSTNLGGVVALQKGHEAFQSDLMARETRVHEVGTLANELDDLGFSRAEEVNNRYAEIYETWQTLVQLTEDRKNNLDKAHEVQLRLDELRVSHAKVSAPFDAFCDEAKENMTSGYVCDTVADAEALSQQHEAFKATLPEHEAELSTITRLQEEMSALGGGLENPYCSQSTAAMAAKWQDVQALVPVRDQTISEEVQRQESREGLRGTWGQQANNIHAWIVDQAAQVKAAVEGAGFNKMEDQLAAIHAVEAAVVGKKPAFDELENTTSNINENLIFDNSHSEHTIETLRGLWGQLNSNIKAFSAELSNQILTRDSRGITEEQMKEYKESFNFFDKDGAKKLDRTEFRACLVSLGYDIPQLPKEGEDQEFEQVLARVDPNNDGVISFEEFVAFMAEENADAETSDQLLTAFKVLAGEQPYVTADQLRRDLSPELAEYCIANMAPFQGEGVPEGALDYTSFSAALYGMSAP